MTPQPDGDDPSGVHSLTCPIWQSDTPTDDCDCDADTQWDADAEAARYFEGQGW